MKRKATSSELSTLSRLPEVSENYELMDENPRPSAECEKRRVIFHNIRICVYYAVYTDDSQRICECYVAAEDLLPFVTAQDVRELIKTMRDIGVRISKYTELEDWSGIRHFFNVEDIYGQCPVFKDQLEFSEWKKRCLSHLRILENQFSNVREEGDDDDEGIDYEEDVSDVSEVSEEECSMNFTTLLTNVKGLGDVRVYYTKKNQIVNAYLKMSTTKEHSRSIKNKPYKSRSTFYDALRAKGANLVHPAGIHNWIKNTLHEQSHPKNIYLSVMELGGGKSNSLASVFKSMKPFNDLCEFVSKSIDKLNWDKPTTILYPNKIRIKLPENHQKGMRSLLSVPSPPSPPPSKEPVSVREKKKRRRLVEVAKDPLLVDQAIVSLEAKYKMVVIRELKQQLTPKVKAYLIQKYTESVSNALREELTPQIREELTPEIREEIRREIAADNEECERQKRIQSHILADPRRAMKAPMGVVHDFENEYVVSKMREKRKLRASGGFDGFNADDQELVEIIEGLSSSE